MGTVNVATEVQILNMLVKYQYASEPLWYAQTIDHNTAVSNTIAYYGEADSCSTGELIDWRIDTYYLPTI